MMVWFQHNSRRGEPATAVHGQAGWRKSSYSGNEGNCIEAAPLVGVSWHKSSHSGDTGNCIEAALLGQPAWQTSSHSGTQGNCVEVASRQLGAVAVRDSKDPDGAKLLFPAVAWREFTRTLKA
jgi:hypothetical protein